MLRSKNGEKLYRRVEVKVNFPPDILPAKTLTYKSAPHQGYAPDGVDEILMHTATQLDQLYPWWEFKMVPLAPRGRVLPFSFVVVGTKAMPDPEKVSTEGLTEAPNV